MILDSISGVHLVIQPGDSPELLYAAIRDMHQYVDIDDGSADEEHVIRIMDRMEDHFGISHFVGELESPIDPGTPGLVVDIDIDDFALAIVGLGYFTLEYSPESVDEVLPALNATLSSIDQIIAQAYK